MPVYGSVRYGVRRYGAYALPPATAQAQSVIGGQSLWRPDFTIPWRTAQAAVWTIDPDTEAPVQQLPGLGLGCRREASLENDRYQVDTLTLVLNDAEGYLPGGPYAGLVAFNQLLRVFWTVASPGGTYAYHSPLYSVQSAPSRDDDVLGGGALTVVAQDVATVRRRIPYASSGFIDPGINPPALFPVFGPDWFSRFYWPPEQGPIPVTVPGTVATWTDVLDFLWPWHPFRLVYDTTGAEAVREGLNQMGGSPWLLSTDPAAAGVLAVPWETLAREVRDAAFTRVEYHWIYDLPSNVTEGGTIGSDVLGTATSTSSVNPHRLTPPPHIQQTFDRTPYQTGGNVAPPVLIGISAWAQYLLDQELRQRDVVTLAVDSACPVQELGVAIEIHDPPRVDGRYQLVGVSQPLDEPAATWTLGWVVDA